MNGQPDAVVGDAVLREIVSPDFFAAIARTHHRLAFLGQRVLLLLHLHLVQPRAQYAHPFLAVLDLRFLILAAHYGVGRNVGNAHRGISRVDRLPARTGRTERVNAQVFGLDLDVHIFGFGQHGYRHCGCVYAPLLLGSRHTLHPVDATLIFHPRKNSLPLDDCDHFLQTTH